MSSQIISDIIGNPFVASLEPSATVHDAVQEMSTHNVSAIAIVNVKKQLLGIVSEHDMTHRVLALGLGPQATKISDVMSKNVETLGLKDTALDAIELMLNRDIRHLPVVDENGQVLAMISMRDLMKGTRNDLNVEIAEDLKIAFAPTSL